MGLELVVMSEEVERAEAEHFTPTVKDIFAAETTVAPGKLTEKPEAYAARRRFEGASDKDIARELREAACHYSTIGRTLKPLPEVANSAYGKRGKKLVHG